MNLFHKYVKGQLCIRHYSSTCWERLDPLLLEFICFCFGKGSFIESFQSLNVALTVSSCSMDRFNLILKPGLGCQNHFIVLDTADFWVSFLLNHLQYLDEFTISSKPLCTVHPSVSCGPLTKGSFCLPLYKETNSTLLLFFQKPELKS